MPPTTSTQDGPTAPAPHAPALPTRLEHLIGDTDAFFREHWAHQPVVLRAPVDLSGLISEEEMWAEVECGLLSRPYFTVFNEGVRTAISDMSTKRRVVGHELAGYIRPEQIHADWEAGATFKFNQAEHWHPRIRALVQGMQPHFRGGLESFVFLSPPGKTAMRAHYDGAHVFVLQVAGTKDWVFGRIHPDSTSDSTIHEGVIPDDQRVETTLRPGDVLYMPHGTPPLRHRPRGQLHPHRHHRGGAHRGESRHRPARRVPRRPARAAPGRSGRLADPVAGRPRPSGRAHRT
jgi:ribosomal protein L16 Arg81 hydroxylase